ncbi:MAG: glycosyltransferase family 4 protein [Leptospiraceae bacterium]|nr:glycosyltransferase family 4 protein [Leptospiraceae bacterium]
MKKILFITDYFRPEPGGVEGLNTGLSLLWEAGMIEVVAPEVSISSRDHRMQFDSRLGFPVHRISSGRAREFHQFVAHRIRACQPDTLLLGAITDSTRIATTVAQEYELPWSVILYSSDLPSVSLLKAGNRKVLNRARYVFTLSRYLMEQFSRKGVDRDRLIALPPALDFRWSNGKLPMPAFPDSGARLKKKLLLLSVGPLVRARGLEMIFPVLDHLEDLRTEIHWIVAGSGPEYSYLNELTRIHKRDDQITFTGFLSDEHLGGLMQNCDMMVDPGRLDPDNYSFSVMEAGRFGLPVISVRGGGMEELVVDEGTGLLADDRSPEDLARCIRKLVNDPGLRKKLSQEAERRSDDEFDIARAFRSLSSRL